MSTATTELPAIDLNALSSKELEALLKQKKKEEQDVLSARRKEYEAKREKLINELGTFAENTALILAQLKLSSFAELGEFRAKMLEYGDLRGGDKNKGSFEIKNERYKIEFRSQINKQFDERAELAEAKLKEFLASFVRNKDKKLHKMLMSLLERNAKTGDFDISLINRLYTMENDFDDPRWKEALNLFKEAYSPTGTAQYVKFSRMTAGGSWEGILLDFAKTKTPVTVAEEATA